MWSYQCLRLFPEQAALGYWYFDSASRAPLNRDFTVDPTQAHSHQDKIFQNFNYAVDNLPYTAIPRAIDLYVSSNSRSAKESSLYRAIWDMGRQNRDYTVCISVEQLAKNLGTTTDSIKRARKKLYDKGLLTWDKVRNPNGSVRTTRWFLCMPDELLKKIDSENPRAGKKQRQTSPVPEKDKLATESPVPETSGQNGSVPSVPSAHLAMQRNPIPSAANEASPKVIRDSINSEKTSSDALSNDTDADIKPVLDDEERLLEKMTSKEVMKFNIYVKVQGSSMSPFVDKNTKLTDQEIATINAFGEEVRIHNQREHRKAAESERQANALARKKILRIAMLNWFAKPLVII